MLAQPYVPVNVAALSEAGLAGEIQAPVGPGFRAAPRGRDCGPSAAPWVDTTASFSQGDAANLASGLQVAGADQLVLNDGDLASAGSTSLTFAQPFNLDLGHGTTVTAAASDSTLGALFTATPADPVLGAQQLLAGLSFVHFENPFKPDPRGIVVVPPSGWRVSDAFMDTLLAGLTQNPALMPVTLNELFGQVPVGGNDEPSTRRLQAGPAGPWHHQERRRRGSPSARQQLSSWCCGPSAAVSGHPAALTALGDLLLSTESQRLSSARALRRADRLRQGVRPPRRGASPWPPSAP